MSNSSYCAAEFDQKGFQWDNSPTDVLAHRDCPFTICSHCLNDNPQRYKLPIYTRFCNTSGSWHDADTEICKNFYFNFTDCIERTCNTCPDTFMTLVRNITLFLSSLSIIALATCLLIFCKLKCLHCNRLTIHKHLAIVFILRYSAMIIWIVGWSHHIFSGCGWLDEKFADVLCKIVLFCIMYFTVASVFWMFVEGIYLVAQISIFALKPESPLQAFYSLGWGCPLIWTVAWAVQIEKDSTTKGCWMPYLGNKHTWILFYPIFIILTINLCLLIFVISVLVRKLFADNVVEPQKLQKACKASLFLVVILGLTNLLFFYEPDASDSKAIYDYYMLVNSALAHSQGLFIGLVYCFFNNEIRRALSTQVFRVMLAYREFDYSYRQQEQRPLDELTSRTTSAPITARESLHKDSNASDSGSITGAMLHSATQDTLA